MWNDKETDIDLLGHATLARTIGSIIRETNLAPLTVGVFGNWGAGKSSILKMLEKDLSEDGKTACITFNSWLFQGYDDTKSVVMQAIISELSKQQPLNEKLQEKAKNLLKRVDWLKLTRYAASAAFTGFTGIPDPSLISAIVGKITSVIQNPGEALSPEQLEGVKEAVKGSIKAASDERNVPEEIIAFRKEFEDLLQTAKIDRLVVLVDDLDRCLPETSIAILEAIRLFLYVPGTVFIIAADENMIAYAVRKHFPDLPASVGPADYTRNYLEKLIQIPFRVPPVGKMETRTYVTLLLGEYALRENPAHIKLLQDAANEIFARPWEGHYLDETRIATKLGSMPEELKEALLLSNRIGNVLAEGVEGNPRQIKRFLNTLMVRLRIAETQGIGDLIDKNVLAKLMLLERFNEPIFQEVFQMVAESSNGQCKQLSEFENSHDKSSEAKDDGKSGEKAAASKFPKSWSEIPWLVAWSKIEPLVNNTDLRPYLYVSREKSPGFSTSMGLSDELNEIAEKLGSGNAILIAGYLEHVKSLIIPDAKKIFQYLSERAKENSDWKIRPKEMEGIYALIKHHEDLQNDLLALFENLPVNALGAWIVTGTNSLFTTATASARFELLKNKWGHQDENSVLKSAVESMGNL